MGLDETMARIDVPTGFQTGNLIHEWFDKASVGDELVTALDDADKLWRFLRMGHDGFVPLHRKSIEAEFPLLDGYEKRF